MKIAVIGAGKWGSNIIRTLSQLDALGAIVEAQPKAREKAIKDFPGTPILSSLTELSPKDTSAVAIATPVTTHYEVAKKAIELGFDVFVEKPLCLSVDESESLCQLAKQKSRILMVGHLLLYQPAIRWIANYIKEGGIGKLVSLHQERLNLGTARSAENALWSLGVHDVAVLLDLVGRGPTEVTATGQCHLNPNIEDDIYLHLKFSDGLQAHLHCSWFWPDKRRCLTVIGDKAMLVYDELAQTVTLHKKGIGSDLGNRDQGTEVVFKQSGAPLQLEMEHFLARLNDRQRPLSDGENAVEVIKVLETATRQLERK